MPPLIETEMETRFLVGTFDCSWSGQCGGVMHFLGNKVGTKLMALSRFIKFRILGFLYHQLHGRPSWTQTRCTWFLMQNFDLCKLRLSSTFSFLPWEHQNFHFLIPPATCTPIHTKPQSTRTCPSTCWPFRTASAIRRCSVSGEQGCRVWTRG